MKKFDKYIVEAKNTHMEHVEDLIFNEGVVGTRKAINFLRDLRDMLAGHSKTSVSRTVKWDGAPAVFAGIDPNDGKFFVAKKGVFNKDPKVYKTPADVDADTSGDLADKLKVALRELPALGIKGVVQGDFLYGPGDVKTTKINGESYVTFHPNTIVYAVPSQSPGAAAIKKSKIGIVWHTTYKGNSFESMRASYGVNVSKFKSTRAVWSQDAMLRDLTNVTMSKSDTEEVNEYLSQAGKILNKISGTTLRQLEQQEELQKLIETYGNTFVRAGTVLEIQEDMYLLISWIKQRYQKEIVHVKPKKVRMHSGTS